MFLKLKHYPFSRVHIFASTRMHRSHVLLWDAITSSRPRVQFLGRTIMPRLRRLFIPIFTRVHFYQKLPMLVILLQYLSWFASTPNHTVKSSELLRSFSCISSICCYCILFFARFYSLTIYKVSRL